jgi:hypothetical protein
MAPVARRGYALLRGGSGCLAAVLALLAALASAGGSSVAVAPDWHVVSVASLLPSTATCTAAAATGS